MGFVAMMAMTGGTLGVAHSRSYESLLWSLVLFFLGLVLFGTTIM